MGHLGNEALYDQHLRCFFSEIPVLLISGVKITPPVPASVWVNSNRHIVDGAIDRGRLTPFGHWCARLYRWIHYDDFIPLGPVVVAGFACEVLGVLLAPMERYVHAA